MICRIFDCGALDVKAESAQLFFISVLKGQTAALNTFHTYSQV